MEELMSAEERKARIAASIIHDFDTKPRLNDDRPLGGEIDAVAATIRDGSLIAAVEDEVGALR